MRMTSEQVDEMERLWKGGVSAAEIARRENHRDERPAEVSEASCKDPERRGEGDVGLNRQVGKDDH